MSNPKLSVGERLGWQKCDSDCDDGTVYNPAPPGIGEVMPCSECHGIGWTPPAELVERVKKRLNVSPRWRKLTDDEARAVLLEQARWIGEQ